MIFIFYWDIFLKTASTGSSITPILLNYFVLSHYIAAGQNFESDDGLQKALKKLQSAAGIFAHLKEISVGAIQRDPTPDLDPDTLGILAGNCEITDLFNVIIREMGKELIFKK